MVASSVWAQARNSRVQRAQQKAAKKAAKAAAKRAAKQVKQ